VALHGRVGARMGRVGAWVLHRRGIYWLLLRGVSRLLRRRVGAWELLRGVTQLLLRWVGTGVLLRRVSRLLWWLIASHQSSLLSRNNKQK
jgi:hypothetical protein